jgi:hypothetical protein
MLGITGVILPGGVGLHAVLSILRAVRNESSWMVL